MATPNLPFAVVHEPIPLIDLTAQHREIGGDVMAALERVVASQRFILGEEVALLEGDLAAYCDARYAIGCASGTDALLLSLMALDLAPGDEVITTAYSFFASGSAIVRAGARPVFVDIDPVSFNLDPEAVAAAVTSRTRAILPVHLFGQVAEMEPLWRLAARHGLAIIEDACQAIGAEYNGRRAGILGGAGCFSFFPTKNLGGAGDGGLITTDDEDFAARVRRLRVHGESAQYHHEEVGLNSRLDALQAAVLRVKLPHLDRWTAARQRNASRYAELFRQYDLLDAVEIPRVLPGRRHVFNQYVVRIGQGRRDEVLNGLRQREIGCNVYYPRPLHLQPCFAEWGCAPGDCPEAERASRESLALPIYPELRYAQQERVVQAIASILGRTVRSSLPPRPKFLGLARSPRALALSAPEESPESEEAEDQ
jgi:dTDP-4-amino-4,6-dideoxygalactose transaminase